MVSVEEMEAVTFAVLLDSLRAPQWSSRSYSLDLTAFPYSALNLNSGFVPCPHLLICHHFVKILNVTVFPNYSSFPSILIVTTVLSCMRYYRYFLTDQCHNLANTSLSHFFLKTAGFHLILKATVAHSDPSDEPPTLWLIIPGRPKSSSHLPTFLIFFSLIFCLC